MSLVVAPCSHDAAKYAVINWHYSLNLPPPKLVTFGVWENEQFVGAVVYGRGATEKLVAPYGLDPVEGCELVRVAMRDHKAPVSQVVAQTLKQLKESSPGLRLVVSFADPYRGHRGAIYQAGNWIYAGKSNPSRLYRCEKTGKEFHERVVSETGYKKQYGVYKPVRKPSELTEIRLPGKHRYLYPLDRAMRRQVQRLALPYPSADEGSTVSRDTSGVEVQVRPLPSALEKAE